MAAVKYAAMAYPRKPGADWNLARRLYHAEVKTGTMSIRALAKRIGVSHPTLIERRDREGWDSAPLPNGTTEAPTNLPVLASPIPFPGKQKKSPARIEQIVADFAAGLNRTVVAARNGITMQTLREWEEEDEELAARILHAQAEFPAECVSTIREEVRRGNSQTAFTVLKTHPLTKADFAEGGKGGFNITLHIPLPGSIPDPVTIEHEPEAA